MSLICSLTLRAIIDELKKYPQLEPESVREAIKTALNLVPNSDRSTGSCELSLQGLAAHRPVLAFELRSHDSIPSIVATLRETATAADTTADVVHQIEEVLEPAFLMLLASIRK